MKTITENYSKQAKKISLRTNAPKLLNAAAQACEIINRSNLIDVPDNSCFQATADLVVGKYEYIKAMRRLKEIVKKATGVKKISMSLAARLLQSCVDVMQIIEGEKSLALVEELIVAGFNAVGYEMSDYVSQSIGSLELESVTT